MANNNELFQPMPKLELIRASDIEPKEIEWLWYPFIPCGKVTLLQGDPGDGKSTFILTIAALLTKGEPLPFTEPDEQHSPINVIYQTTEDDADDTIVPRFIKAGGDRDRLIFISEDKKALTFDDERIGQAVAATFGEIDSIGDRGITGKYTVSQDDLEKLKSLAKDGVASRGKISSLKKDLAREKRNSSALTGKLEMAQEKLRDVTERYEKMEEAARPLLAALQRFPDKVKAFLDGVFSEQESWQEHGRPDRQGEETKDQEVRKGSHSHDTL